LIDSRARLPSRSADRARWSPPSAPPAAHRTAGSAALTALTALTEDHSHTVRSGEMTSRRPRRPRPPPFSIPSKTGNWNRWSPCSRRLVPRQNRSNPLCV